MKSGGVWEVARLRGKRASDLVMGAVVWCGFWYVASGESLVAQQLEEEILRMFVVVNLKSFSFVWD